MKGASKIYHEGLVATGKRSTKRPLYEKVKIIIYGLRKYPQIERTFKAHNLEWITKKGESYYPTLAREFYANYTATLENMCKKGKKSMDMPNMDQILV